MGAGQRTGYVAAVVLAVAAYVGGLGSLHIPKNGDEYPYAHITRLTAASGKLLPLRSELFEMRNTKPPLLFWQGIVTTGWGEHWTLFRLRLPSVIYTLLTALMAGLVARRVSGRAETGLLAGLMFLAFLTTYRYGRPFLTNAPEVFWLNVPIFVLLYWGKRAFDSWPVAAALGIAIGVGLLYKSVLLLGPVGITLAWWYLRGRGYRWGEFLRRDVPKLALVAVASLGVFSLWFLLDPDPAAIWQEFIVEENLGKVARGNYLKDLFWGWSSLWVVFLGYIVNAGLLLGAVLVLYISAIRRRKEQSEPQRMLWIWVIVLAVVFTIPAHRSARYILPGMPAIAILTALVWDKIPDFVFRITAGFATAFVLGLCAAAVGLTAFESGLFPWVHWPLLAVALVVAGAGLVRRPLARHLLIPATFLFYLCLSGTLYPFDHDFGTYDADARRAVAGRDVWMPMNFNAKYERYYFLLPEATIHGYDELEEPSLEELAARYPRFAIQLPGDETPPAGYRILGTRWDFRTRQLDVGARVRRIEDLLAKEYLLEAR